MASLGNGVVSEVGQEMVATGGGNKFLTHDKATGEVLWACNSSGMPMTYSLNNEQYIVVPIGARGHVGELVALKLFE